MPATGGTAIPGRLPSVDRLRGAIMFLMALDHVRIYFSNAQVSAVDPERTNLLLFLIRWVTHFCAPGFFLLAGVAVFLYAQRAASQRTVSVFLLTRGAWLIFLELTVIGFAWSFNPGWSWLGVIWSLGGSFIAMAALIHLRPVMLLLLSAAVILLHAVPGDWYFATLDGPPGTVGAILYGGGPASLPILGQKGVLYSLLPWLAMMGFGYGLGPLFAAPPPVRRAALLKVGLGMTAAFVVMRLTNAYGNPAEIFLGGWSGEFSIGDTVARTIINFLNTDKYPPSPQFALMTLGPLISALGLLATGDGAPARRAGSGPLAVAGKVPMFFYVVHLYLIHGLALAAAFVTGGDRAVLFWGGVFPALRPPAGYGYGDFAVLAIWFGVSFLLFLGCRRYAGYKAAHDHRWLRYL